jgi:arylsulfatase A-like enzyme
MRLSRKLHVTAALVAFVLCGPALADPRPDQANQERPNIVLIVAEDLSPRVGAFGDLVAQTPNLDALAAQGTKFTGLFSASGVCAPNRSALITGVYPQTLGTQHMRTSTLGYEAVPPPEIRAFPELLRRAGYVTGNTAKTDYQFGEPSTVWDVNHGSFSEPPDLALWRRLPQGQPFFAMINLMSTHESRLVTKETRGQGPLGPLMTRLAAAREAQVKPVTNPQSVTVPKYYPDTPAVRQSIAQHYDNIHFMDGEVGQVMTNLEADGLLDKTIVLWTTDHGDGLPRAKRSVYDSGLHIPLIARFPSSEDSARQNLDGVTWKGKGKARQEDGRLLSIVDLAPYILTLAGIAPPEFIQGQSFLDAEGGRQYVYAGRDRMDHVPDYVRAVRDGRYKYIRNYRPELTYYRPLVFRDMFPVMQSLWRQHNAGTLNPDQDFYFTAPRPVEELYDLAEDPQELSNVAGLSEYQETLARMRAALDRWLEAVGDRSEVGEDAMIETMWPGGEQPLTLAPQIVLVGQKLTMASKTIGASVTYRFANDPRGWQLYACPLVWPQGAKASQLEAKAVRYGFKESAVVSYPDDAKKTVATSLP